MHEELKQNNSTTNKKRPMKCVGNFVSFICKSNVPSSSLLLLLRLMNDEKEK